MGLDQNLYAVSFNEKNFPKRFFAKDYMNKDGDMSLEICELKYFRKNNLLQGYFETKHGIENCEYVIVSDDDIQNLLDVCDNFLKHFSKNFVQEVQDYYNLSLKEYAKKYVENFSDITINQNNAGKVNINFFDNINKRFIKIVSKNKECLEIIEEKLPITEGFFYGNYNLDIDYLISIIEIKEAFKNVEQYLLNNDKEKIYYYCWY